ncbi:MAG: Holliday junction resolvase RuvX, partial [Clostridia bacterium]|nr:Holliday junction resolvase RuvX [Clostridia bacterium]
FAEAIQKEWDGEIVFFDERLTTMTARRVLLDADISRGKQKKVIDKLAAVIILQGYMDSHPNL